MRRECANRTPPSVAGVAPQTLAKQESGGGRVWSLIGSTPSCLGLSSTWLREFFCQILPFGTVTRPRRLETIGIKSATIISGVILPSSLMSRD